MKFMQDHYWGVSSVLIAIKHLPRALLFFCHLLVSKMFLLFKDIPIAKVFDIPASAKDLRKCSIAVQQDHSLPETSHVRYPSLHRP